MLIFHTTTTEKDMQNDSNQTKMLLVSENIQQNQEQIDDGAFYIKNENWGTWKSFNKEGTPLVTALTREECINSTRFYLKSLQENSRSI